LSVRKLPEPKSLLKESESLLRGCETSVVEAVYDYWLSKRLRLQHSLIPTVKTEVGMGPANDPYIAFRRRKDKMQTRKNRKNDETSYEKMLKLKKDLSYAYALFQMVQKRESIKLQLARLHMELYQKRYEARDFNAALLNEVKSLKRPALQQQLYGSSLAAANQTMSWLPKVAKDLKKMPLKTYFMDDVSPKKEKRHYKKRKRSRLQNGFDASATLVSSDEEKSEMSSSPVGLGGGGGGAGVNDENPFAFKRQKNCVYLAPIDDQCPWDYDVDDEENDRRRRFHPAYVITPRLKSVGFARRRLGRGGRIVLDRAGVNVDDVWSSLGYTIKDTAPLQFPRYRPKTPSVSSSDEADDAALFYESDDSTTSLLLKPLLEVENLLHHPAVESRVCLEIDLNSPLKHEPTYSILERMASCVDLLPHHAKSSSENNNNNNNNATRGGSILERWTKQSRKRPSPKTPTNTNFCLGPDADTIGCSTFRTISEDYFEGSFNFNNKNAASPAAVDQPTTTEKSLTQLLMSSDSELLHCWKT
jgi:enhancer of polycomb-like protein